MWVVVVGATWGVAWGVLAMAQRIHPWFGWSVEVWMIFTTLAGRSLARAAQEVERPLRENDLAESRIKLSWIVGRDTSQLQPAQIIAPWWKRLQKTPLTALSRRSFSSFSAARRWRWPTKPSIPWIQWWATNMKNTGRLGNGQPPYGRRSELSSCPTELAVAGHCGRTVSPEWLAGAAVLAGVTVITTVAQIAPGRKRVWPAP
ncbi:cobalamin biosynthesis protein [Salmonella enterica subsp. enterica]|uniref:Cobalamin biosynthesis protein n=1 Tax=Salmonella enterica I TaxID=59201 RepID=A0A379VNZ0_SALET|nr:cobalamin biosynthesis protein [Salmonella enterica subsp. enterica]